MLIQKRGFALIELLVVLVIIGVIAALLFPVFSRPNHNAPRSSCQSQLKQMGLSVKMYVQGYNEKYPHSGVLSSTRDDGWVRVLQPYLKSYQLFQCPSDESKQNEAAGSTLVTDYYYNGRLAHRSEAELNYISSTILFGEGEPASSNYACSSFNHCIGNSLNGPITKLAESAKVRHLEGSNYAFADGHVKWIKPRGITAVTKNGGYGFNFG